MLLSNVHIVGVNELQHIYLDAGKIKLISTNKVDPCEERITFNNAIAFPGLINSHDHLDFNLFPQLGNRIYNNYAEWGEDIHTVNKAEIDAVLEIPQELRAQWGLYKNLLNGVTTVINHGEKMLLKNELITVFQNTHSLHSVAFEKNWKWKLNNPFKKKQPIVIHTGEGTDEKAGKEIDELIKANYLNKKLIGVHGVAMKVHQAAAFEALIWCPVSNMFLLNKTAPVEAFRKVTRILLGTDSTLTASWNIWEHLRLARRQDKLSDQELFNAVTKTAAEVWELNDRGSIACDLIADIVVARGNDSTANAFYAINPADILLVLQRGSTRLFDESIKEQVLHAGVDINNFHKIVIDTATKYIYGDIRGLMEKVRSYHPGVSFPVHL